jgi:pimeloyl-ACP methyl ester carboxylesterase
MPVQAPRGVSIEFNAGGEGAEGVPTLVLLHGLGVNTRAWDAFLPLVKKHWPGRWIAPDLRGHGRSGHRPPYSYGTHAADVAGLLMQDEDIAVIGHSMGGVVAMALATGWFGPQVRCALAFGVKLSWQDEEVEKLRQLATGPARLFDTHKEAVERYMLVSGMKGLIAADSQTALSGVSEIDGKFRLTSDPAINAVAGPPVEAFFHAAAAPVRLAAGAGDVMVTRRQMNALDPEAVVVDGAGHNLHIERPDALWEIFTELMETD